MRTVTPTALLVAATLGLAACGDRTDMPLGVVIDDGGGEAVTVEVSDATGDTTPTYSWTGGAARQLAVVRLSDGAVMWRIEAVGTEGFDGSVRHGLVPVGAQQTRDATILSVGTDFSVQVVTLDGTRGSTTFTP